MWIVIGLIVTVLIIGAIVALAKVYYVAPGNVGVLIYKSGQNEKGVADKPITPGWGFRKLFVEDVFEYPTFLQTAIWTKSSIEGSENDDSITANSKEGLAINMDVSASYTLDPNRIPDLYIKYRAEIEDIQKTFLRQSIRQAIQDNFGQYTVDQLYGEKKQEVTTKIQKDLSKRLAGDGFIFQQFTINEIRLPDNVKESINQKIQASQGALKAEQDLVRIRVEAEQRTTQAKAEAEAIKMQSEAANNDKYVALKRLEVEKAAIEKWNGVLPVTMLPGGSVPFVNLNQ